MPVIHIPRSAIAQRPILHILIRALKGTYVDAENRDVVAVEISNQSTMVDIWDQLSPAVINRICEDISPDKIVHPGVLALMKVRSVLELLKETMLSPNWGYKVHRPENLVMIVHD